MEIGKILTAVGLSVQQAQDILARQDIEIYMRQFENAGLEGALSDNSCTALVPKTIRFALAGESQNKYVDVPVAVMTTHETILLKQVKVTIKGEIYEDEQTENIMLRADSSQNESSGANIGTIEMIFDSGPQSEGEARTTQKLLNEIDI